MRLKPKFVETLPPTNEIKNGEIWISILHKTINLRCPCGCNDLTVLSIHPNRWHIYFDGKKLTLSGNTGGSVLAKSSECGSHYFINKNEILWAERIDPLLYPEYEKKELSEMVQYYQNKPTSLNWFTKIKNWISSLLDRFTQ